MEALCKKYPMKLAAMENFETSEISGGLLGDVFCVMILTIQDCGGRATDCGLENL